MAAVTEQTTEAFDWKQISYKEVEFTETSLITNPWYDKHQCVNEIVNYDLFICLICFR